MKLYQILLGGKRDEGLFGEDHQIILLIANNLDEAKKMAKTKWNGIQDGLHVDDIKEIDVVDGYDILLRKQ